MSQAANIKEIKNSVSNKQTVRKKADPFKTQVTRNQDSTGGSQN